MWISCLQHTRGIVRGAKVDSALGAVKHLVAGEQRKVSDIVVYGLTNESETFMIGVVTKPNHTIVEAREVLGMGRLIPGDEVFEVHKFEPTQTDSIDTF